MIVNAVLASVLGRYILVLLTREFIQKSLHRHPPILDLLRLDRAAVSPGVLLPDFLGELRMQLGQ